MVNPDFTVSDVLAWARTKPADEVYDYGDANKCAIAQFGVATGRAHLVGINARTLAPDLWKALNDGKNYGEPIGVYTFGHLVKNLEALCPETPVTKSDWLAIDAYLTDDLVSV